MRENEIKNQGNGQSINQTPGSIVKNSLLAAFGLFCFGIGVYLTIQANIGVAPWDTLYLGVHNTFGIQYGTTSITVSFLIMGIDLLLKERIGIGTILDAIIVGKTVDLCNWLDFVPAMQNIWTGIPLMLVGLFIMGFSQFIYMKAGLCCGPRDALLVALGKRLPKVPIGGISIGIMVVVFIIGFFLNGPVGIGTVVAVVCTGPLMQFAFSLVKFKPIQVVHQDLITTAKVFMGKNREDSSDL